MNAKMKQNLNKRKKKIKQKTSDKEWIKIIRHFVFSFCFTLIHPLRVRQVKKVSKNIL